ncbi:hypothetical protein ACJ73_08770 [Blastomyces percursus]|uniref:Uncharacterized protein n=1 Tax=Blastomyces percursus TaxID=1658174 RepID=A0A1J9QNL8_9EURO|nr:hypothetical protein ACJ73_08770 [Blastomyces percursus]
MSSLLQHGGDSKQGHHQAPYRIDSRHLAMPFSKPVARLLSTAALGMESGETPVYTTGTCGDYRLSTVSRDGRPYWVLVMRCIAHLSAASYAAFYGILLASEGNSRAGFINIIEAQRESVSD